MGSNNDFELQLRALRAEVEGIRRKLTSTGASDYSHPNDRSSEGHSQRQDSGGATPVSHRAAVDTNGDFGGKSVPNGGCAKDTSRSSGALSLNGRPMEEIVGGGESFMSVNAWILEAGTVTGQLARAQRALQDMALQRDAAVYRHKEAVRTNDLLRKRLEELGELKALYKQLQDEYLLLQKSYRSSEHIRLQQKELINALKGSGAVFRTAKEGGESRATGGARNAYGPGTAAATAPLSELPINVDRPDDFFLNYSLQHGGPGTAEEAAQSGAADLRSGRGLASGASPRPSTRGKKSSTTGGRKARSGSGGDEREVWRGGAAEPRALARSGGAARGGSSPFVMQGKQPGRAGSAPPRGPVGGAGASSAGTTRAVARKAGMGGLVNGGRSTAAGAVVGGAVASSSRGVGSSSASQSFSGTGTSGRALGLVGGVSSRGVPSSSAAAGGTRSLKTRW